MEWRVLVGGVIGFIFLWCINLEIYLGGCVKFIFLVVLKLRVDLKFVIFGLGISY